MKKYISDIADSIPPSGIRKFFEIVHSTPGCISLGVGEPDFVTPWKISDQGIYAIKDGYTHYTSNRGLPKLCRLISENIQSSSGISYNPEKEIIVTVGVSQALDLALRALINPGDEVIIIEPCYVSYASNISLVYGTTVRVPVFKDEGFQINIERLKKAVTSKTKAVILNYPSNPTGINISPEILKEISEIAVSNDLVILSDEIYSSISYEEVHHSIISIPGMKERTVYLNGFSKSHAMTGWRLGYTAGPENIISAMLKIHQYTALCAPSIAQYAAIEALENGDRDVDKMKAEYTGRRNFIAARFNEIGLPCPVPSGAFYVFPDITPTGLTSEEFALKLLEKQTVAVVPGNVFGECGEGHVRCSYATSIENIKEAMIRIENFTKSL
ncbi:MAG: aminotransferase class I/II-fold pyridoxal phosphate-dependent enzyme [Spirochaetes bacterium]|nr:aminotransferase class I/II-fold pyridoxal phosphate-dependent enzyme [Spirochaetota bacterium]